MLKIGQFSLPVSALYGNTTSTNTTAYQATADNSTKQTSSTGSMGIMDVLNSKPTQGQDPDEFAQLYADAKGITLDEAKAELKAQYGDPPKREETEGVNATSEAASASANSQTTNTEPVPRPGQDPDEFAQEYANYKGISLDEAKTELQAKYGAPQKEQSDK